MDIQNSILGFIVNVIPILAGIYILVGVKILKQKEENGINYFSMLMFACAIYSFGYFLELNCVLFDTLILVRNFEFLGALFIPTFGILFIAQLAQRKIANRAVAILFMISTALWIIFATNPMHNLFYRSLDLQLIQGFAVVFTAKGPGYYLLMAYYAFFLIFSSIIMLKAYKVAMAKNEKASFRFMFIIFQIPWIAILIVLFGFDKYFDPSPTTIMIICGLLMANEAKNDTFKLRISKWKRNYADIEELALLVDEEGSIVCSNAAASSLFDELGIDTNNLISDIDSSKLKNEPFAVEINGEIEWFAVYKNYFDIKKDYITYLLIDITERKQTEDELIENRNRLVAAQSMVQVGSWELNINTNTIWASEESFNIYGFDYSSPYLPLDLVQDSVLPKYRKRLNAALANLITKNSRYDEEFIIKNNKTGKEIFVQSIAVLKVDVQGNGLKVIGTIQDITQRKQIQERLAEKEANIRAITDAANDAIIVMDQEGIIVFWNPSAENILGYASSEAIGKNLHNLIAPINYHEAHHAGFSLFQRTGQGKAIGKTLDLEALKKDNTKIFIQLSLSAMHTNNGWHSVGIIRDITKSKQLEQELINSKERQASIFNQSPIAIEIYDSSGCLISVNDASIKLFGIINADELKGFKLFDDPNISEEMKRKLLNKESVKIESRFDFEKVKEFGLYETNKSGIIDLELFISTLLREQKVDGYIVQIQDVTAQKQAKEKIEFLSYSDQLTGIYNRRGYEQELARLDEESYYPLSLIMADVNGLKLTNDAFGHKSGDLLLQKVSKVLKGECRQNDIVARIGGDEFVILLPKTDAKNTEIIIARIAAAIKNQKINNIILSVSMGYAVKQETFENMNEVFMKAEDDMYKYKLSESASMRSKTVSLIVNSLFEKNNEEMLHSKRVGEICSAIARKLNFSNDEVNEVKVAGLMHDIGKIGISDSILNKPKSLNNTEWAKVKRHCEIGYRILGSVNEFTQIAEYVLAHHEKWDGTGYPKGLKGVEISLQARIIAIADAYDAMTSVRIYSKALKKDEAIAEIEKCSGTQFDPEVVTVFLEMLLDKN